MRILIATVTAGAGHLEHAPEIWGLRFGKTDDPAVVRRLSRKLEEMAASAKALGRPDAAVHICQLVCKHLEP